MTFPSCVVGSTDLRTQPVLVRRALEHFFSMAQSRSPLREMMFSAVATVLTQLPVSHWEAVGVVDVVLPVLVSTGDAKGECAYRLVCLCVECLSPRLVH